mmetsp:Transcript_3599/g.7091  ORF Transcript_3599/g.7091 Transcript_3599/m.7091 type:complete len:234 (-) Transcript_3599:1147-1848(-)
MAIALKVFARPTSNFPSTAAAPVGSSQWLKTVDRTSQRCSRHAAATATGASTERSCGLLTLTPTYWFNTLSKCPSTKRLRSMPCSSTPSSNSSRSQLSNSSSSSSSWSSSYISLAPFSRSQPSSSPPSSPSPRYPLFGLLREPCRATAGDAGSCSALSYSWRTLVHCSACSIARIRCSVWVGACSAIACRSAPNPTIPSGSSRLPYTLLSLSMSAEDARGSLVVTVHRGRVGC